MHLVVCHYTLCFINVIPVPVQIAIVERELLLETVMRSRSLRRTSCLSAWVGRRPCNFALLPATREICHTLRDGACVGRESCTPNPFANRFQLSTVAKFSPLEWQP